MTYLCVPIFVTSVEQARRDLALAGEAGADMVELRVDQFADAQRINELLVAASVPCIITCRAPYEGGQSEAADFERTALLSAVTGLRASYVDLELAAYEKGYRVQVGRGPRVYRRGLILSAHDFQGRPSRLATIVQELFESPADVAKIVWTARTIRDNLEAYEILVNRQKPTIALCMGEHGLISRVLAKKFGGFLTFASLSKDAETAPGQITIGDMKRLYRWDAIGARTKVYGVVASPVMHSMSPAIHNAAFEAVGHDGVYLPMLVNDGYESFKAFMESFLAFEPLDLAGLSVTLPHKENALRYLKEVGGEVEKLAEEIGAVNTIVVERSDPSTGSGQAPSTGSGQAPSTGSGQAPSTGSGQAERRSDEGEEGVSVVSGQLSVEGGEGRGDKGTRGQGDKDAAVAVRHRAAPPYRLRGLNTDYAAILDSITSCMGISREQLAGYRVAVIGAGGTGRTAVAALAHYGATVVVYNRTMERAEVLAKEFNGRQGAGGAAAKVVAARMEKLCDSCCHIYINCTSVGMSPKVEASPIDGMGVEFAAGTVVFDTIYNPTKTKFFREAEEAGAKVIGGVEMFVRQAGRQFEEWVKGKAAPAEVMRGVVEKRLG